MAQVKGPFSDSGKLDHCFRLEIVFLLCYDKFIFCAIMTIHSLPTHLPLGVLTVKSAASEINSNRFSRCPFLVLLKTELTYQRE